MLAPVHRCQKRFAAKGKAIALRVLGRVAEAEEQAAERRAMELGG